MRRLTSTFIIPIILATGTILSACDNGPGQPLPPSSSTASVNPDPTQGATAIIPEIVAFGTPHSWPTGDTIKVSDPQRHQSFLSVDVELHNGGAAPMQMGTIDSPIMLNASADNVTLIPVAMNTTGFTMPSGYVNSGQTIRYRATFDLPAAGSASLQVIASGVMNDPTRPAVIYQGTV